MINTTTAHTGIIILAAGKSKRFGTDKREALLSGTPLLVSTVQAYAKLSYPIIVVTNDNLSALLKNEITRYADIVALPKQEQNSGTMGMGDSLAAGIQQAIVREWDAALIALGDMPFIQLNTLTQLTQALNTQQALVPVYKDRWGHPVGFQRSLFTPLSALKGDRGGRHILQQAKPKEIPVNDPGVVMDIDTPDQLAQAEQYQS